MANSCKAENVRKTRNRKSRNRSQNTSIDESRNNEAWSKLLSKVGPNPEHLSASSLRLFHLPEHFGLHLGNLETLDLSNNFLRNLPFSIKFLSKLKDLRLNDNYLRCLPSAISELGSLVKLEIANNFLTILCNSWANFSSLEILHVSGNRLNHLPIFQNSRNNQIGQPAIYSTLVQLDMAHNWLSRLPNNICHLENLRVLDVQNNSLEKLPDEIGRLINLRELRANSNLLRGLPDSIRLLANLAYLDLYDNNLEIVPEMLNNMNRLIGLDIDANRIEMDYFTIGGIRYEELRRSLWSRYLIEELGCSPREEHLTLARVKRCNRRKEFSSEDRNERYQKPRKKDETEIEENWDLSEDSADEYDPTCDNVNPSKKSSKSSYLEIIYWGRLYCPASFHPPTIKQQIAELLEKGVLQTRTEKLIEEGQFEDA